MADLELELEPRHLKLILDAARKANPALATALRKRLRGIGNDVVKEMRSQIMATPPSGGRSPGKHSTRKQIAAGISTKIATAKDKSGISIVQSGAKLPPARRPMARAYNKARWRHPVFGNTKTWVSQKGNPSFGRRIKPFEPRAAQEIREALAEMAHEIGLDLD